jgi:hypothetical protein
MAVEKSRFFNYNEAEENEYQADDFAEYFRTYFADGVCSLETNLQVSANGTGMIVSVGYGAASIQGYGYWLKDNSTGVKTLPISAANSSNPRIDRIVARLDKSASGQAITLAVLSGTPAASPSAPALTRADNIYEISLAQVYVGAGVLNIAADKITDERSNNSVCGLCEPAAVRNYINQGLKTTDSPTFAAVAVTGTLEAQKVIGAVYQE